VDFLLRSVWILARPFVKQFALRCQTVVCLSFCMSSNVGVLWPNGWMDQDATWYGGRPRPRPHCVRWGPSWPHANGHSSTPSPRKLSRFTDAGVTQASLRCLRPYKPRPVSVVAKRLDGSGYHLVRR